MTIELSKEAVERLSKLANEENVTPAEMVEALIAAEAAKREGRK